ncbi:MAG: coenzyme F420-0:L-glutamate ligase [Chloroflexi bacterium]|nr:coenzyme F420-0:L-glutamate ligase [Chloroflexota bacterium]MQC17295.1 coenzyme F420-0:L-glutamate ligase [Chloroflexota bacterium]
MTNQPPPPASPADVRVIGIRGIPMVEDGDDLAALILDAATAQGTPPADGDVLVVTQRVVSKAEGRVFPLDDFDPSPFAHAYAARTEKDPRLVEAVLRESNRVIRQVGGVLITETHHGFKCANAGVDGSNVGGEDLVCLLPVDPDASCRALRDAVRERTGVEVAVVMTDTFGRPWRLGQTNVAIGVAGMLPFRDYVGMRDLDGRELRVTTICVADEVAGAAELVMGKLDAIPAALVRGYSYDRGEGSAQEIVREFALDLFP